MPNQRKPTKKHIGGYYEKDLVDAVNRLAEDRGIKRSVLIEELLRAAVADYKRKRPAGGPPRPE